MLNKLNALYMHDLGDVNVLSHDVCFVRRTTRRWLQKEDDVNLSENDGDECI
jgi:hypothetical protein